MFLGVIQDLPQVIGPHKLLRRRKPGAGQNRANQVEGGEHHEGGAPMPVSGNDAADKAPEKSADHGSGYIRRHGPAHAASGPFLINVGEHGSDDARYKKALGETPED